MIELKNILENWNGSFILNFYFYFKWITHCTTSSRGLTLKLLIVVPEQLILNISTPSSGTRIINSRVLFLFEGWDSKTSSLGYFGQTWYFFVYFVSRWLCSNWSTLVVSCTCYLCDFLECLDHRMITKMLRLAKKFRCTNKAHDRVEIDRGERPRN